RDPEQVQSPKLIQGIKHFRRDHSGALGSYTSPARILSLSVRIMHPFLAVHPGSYPGISGALRAAPLSAVHPAPTAGVGAKRQTFATRRGGKPEQGPGSRTVGLSISVTSVSGVSPSTGSGRSSVGQEVALCFTMHPRRHGPDGARCFSDKGREHLPL